MDSELITTTISELIKTGNPCVAGIVLALVIVIMIRKRK